MKNTLKILPALLAFIALTISCSKENDTEAPQISIISPLATDVYVVGDTINIQVQITENDELHHIEADMFRNVTQKVWSRNAHSHEKIYNINDAYIVQEADTQSTFKLQVLADDHNGNANTVSVEFEIE